MTTTALTMSDRALRWDQAAQLIEQHASAAVDGPWECTDCEGELAVRARRALPKWNADDTGYSLPASYAPEDMVLEHDLDTWDRDDDEQDDTQRDTAEWVALMDPLVAPAIAGLLRNCAYYAGEIAGSWHEHADRLADLVLAAGS